MPVDAIPVLIVDDDSFVGSSLLLMLGCLGDSLPCVATRVERGAEALRALHEREYELVLLDYHLPDTDGLELLTKIRQIPPPRQPAVIVLTGEGSEEIAVAAMKRGAQDYLVKGSLGLTTMRRAIAGALDRRRLELELERSNAELRRKNQQMEAELQMAREVQQALLPQQYPVFPAEGDPARSALGFTHRWIPSRGMAGDFFEIFRLGEQAAGVFICDVMGHGVRAALITALLRGLLQDTLPQADQPGLFLKKLNQDLSAILGRTQNFVFATALYLVADLARRELRWANAGHPDPLCLRRRSGVTEWLRAPQGCDPALGLIPDAPFATSGTTWESGDGVFFYTDGLIEAQNPAGEDFGRDRLQAEMARRLPLPLSVILEEMLLEVRLFANLGRTSSFADDLCLVGLELGPTESPEAP